MSGATIDIEFVVPARCWRSFALGQRWKAERERDDRGLGTSVPSAVPTKTTSPTSSRKPTISIQTTARCPLSRRNDGRSPRPAGLRAAGGGAAGGAGHASRARRVAPARGIALEYAAAAGDRPAATRLVVATAGRTSIRRRCWPGWAARGSARKRFDSDCLIAAIDQLCARSGSTRYAGRVADPSRRGRPVFGKPPQPCQGHRAAATPRRWPPQRPPSAANLLVADPRAGSFFQLKQMVAEFARGGVRPCPAVFRERLA